MDTVLIKASALGFTNVVRYVLERASQVDPNVQNQTSDSYFFLLFALSCEWYSSSLFVFIAGLDSTTLGNKEWPHRDSPSATRGQLGRPNQS